MISIKGKWDMRWVHCASCGPQSGYVGIYTAHRLATLHERFHYWRNRIALEAA